MDEFVVMAGLAVPLYFSFFFYRVSLVFASVNKVTRMQKPLDHYRVNSSFSFCFCSIVRCTQHCTVTSSWNDSDMPVDFPKGRSQDYFIIFWRFFSTRRSLGRDTERNEFLISIIDET